MGDASDKREKMEYRVEISFVLAKLIKYNSARIENTARKQKRKASKTESKIHVLDGQKYCPAHRDIADHTERLIFFEIYCGKRGGKSCTSPDDREDYPRPQGRGLHKSAKHHGRITLRTVSAEMSIQLLLSWKQIRQKA